MNETQEPRITNKPDWFEEPNEGKRVLWCCMGRATYKDRSKEASYKWTVLYATKEDAECNASIPRSSWGWDGEPARPVTLSGAMFGARVRGMAGVKVKIWNGTEFEIIATYPANVPLTGGDL